MKKKSNYEFFSYLLLIVLISFLISYSYYITQNALNFVFAKKIINYPDKINPYYLFLKETYSSLFSLISLMLNLGLSNETISRLIIFIATFFNILGIFLVSKSITNLNFLSFLIATTSVFLVKNFGDIDYPTLMFSEHTIGMISQAFCSLIFGLLTLKNLNIAFIVNLIFITVHPIVGLWMFVVSLVTIFYLKLIKERSKFNFVDFKIYFVAILFIILCYCYFLISKSNNVPYDYNLFEYNLYNQHVEAHRVNYGNLKYLYYNYLFKTFSLFFLILLYLKYLKTSNTSELILLLSTLFSIIFSLLIYLTYKYFPELYPDFIIRTIPQRYLITHSIIGYGIIISIFYKFLKNVKKKTKYNYSQYFFIIIIFLHLFQQNESFDIRKKNMFDNSRAISEEKKFWKEANKIVVKNSYILTNNQLCNGVNLNLKIPLLICFESLDFIPYFPKLALPTRLLIKKILGISYEDLQVKNYGGVTDYDLKRVFESKSRNDWLVIQKNLNVSYVLLPKEWKVNLKYYELADKYRLYIIE